MRNRGESITVYEECLLTRYTGPSLGGDIQPVLVNGRRFRARTRAYRSRLLFRDWLAAEGIRHELVTPALPQSWLGAPDLIQAWRKERRQRTMAAGDGYDALAARVLTEMGRGSYGRIGRDDVEVYLDSDGTSTCNSSAFSRIRPGRSGFRSCQESATRRVRIVVCSGTHSIVSSGVVACTSRK